MDIPEVPPVSQRLGYTPGFFLAGVGVLFFFFWLHQVVVVAYGIFNLCWACGIS